MDTTKAQQKLDELRSKRQRKDFWNPKPGTKANRIRILPNWEGDSQGEFYRETGYHRKLGTERDKSAVCLLREGHEKCPVCEEVKELYKTKNKDDADLAKSIRAQVRILYNITDLDSPDKGVQVWMSGVDVLEQLLGFCANPKYGDISDPENGRNIDLFMAEGKNTKSGFNEYNVQPDPERSPIQDPEWLLQMVDLDALVKPISYEELEALLMGRPLSEVVTEEKTQGGTTGETKFGSPAAKPDEACLGKYSSDDPQCENCWEKKKCQESRKERMARKETVREAKEAPSKEVPKEKEPSSKPSSIQDMLAKVREDREKSKK